MQNILRRHLLALMIGATAITFTTPVLFDASAYAENGSDDSGGDDSNDSDSDSSDSDSNDNSSDDNDSDTSDSDDSDNDSDENDDSDSNDDNDRGDDSSDDSDDNDRNDDNSDDNNRSSKNVKKSSKSEKQSENNNTRAAATITLSASSLANVRAGTHVVVDQLGRQLEIRVVTANGRQVIRAKPHGGDAKRNPGPIVDIKVVPATTVARNDDGTPDQGK